MTVRTIFRQNENPPHASRTLDTLAHHPILFRNKLYCRKMKYQLYTPGTPSTPERTVPAQIQFLSIFQRCRSLKLNCNLIKSMFCWERAFSFLLYTVCWKGVVNEQRTIPLPRYTICTYSRIIIIDDINRMIRVHIQTRTLAVVMNRNRGH